MAKVTIKIIHGKKYAYLEKSIRIGNKVRKISKYLGIYSAVTPQKIKEAEALYERELLPKEVDLRWKYLLAGIRRLEYPLTLEEVRKIEEMNVKYHHIMQHLHPKDVDDLNKRFVANYVFESNALEGNSLTLKNVAEIVFERRISSGKDLREIYDAQNSYNLFLLLQKTRQAINHDFILKIHSLVMDKIDDRLGYRKIPIILIGKPNAPLSQPESVHRDMDKLIAWYTEHEVKLYPLELAFKFHAQFERIHPFCDGNGRVGRFLLNYMLMRAGYFPIIIRKTTRNAYLKALEAADREKWLPLLRFALKHYKETFRKFFEVYYHHTRFSTTGINENHNM